MKKHPLFAASEEMEKEEPKPESPKETEEDKQRKEMFHQEVDKVFSAKPWPQDNQPKGKWTPIAPVGEEAKKNTETKTEERDLQDKIDVEMNIEDSNIFDDKSKEEQKKERKERRRKEKEEKKKRKKEKKRKDKETENAEETENPGAVIGDQDQAVNPNAEEQGYGESGYQEYPDGSYVEGWYDENGEFHPNEEGEYYYYYDAEGNIVGYEGPEGYVEGNPFEVRYFLTS